MNKFKKKIEKIKKGKLYIENDKKGCQESKDLLNSLSRVKGWAASDEFYYADQLSILSSTDDFNWFDIKKGIKMSELLRLKQEAETIEAIKNTPSARLVVFSTPGEVKPINIVESMESVISESKRRFKLAYISKDSIDSDEYSLQEVLFPKENHPDYATYEVPEISTDAILDMEVGDTIFSDVVGDETYNKVLVLRIQ